jgi:hypothetical protein
MQFIAALAQIALDDDDMLVSRSPDLALGTDSVKR